MLKEMRYCSLELAVCDEHNRVNVITKHRGRGKGVHHVGAYPVEMFPQKSEKGGGGGLDLRRKLPPSFSSSFSFSR